ncbi:MAG: molecular chaperone HtpG [Spirochaetaceae bacterium]|nr:molecular chaperone HtpG [Myxococcales bacterium]MCB9724875.1 molecular chaperone HtpG [Spirochaetaceae bacterium]HPG26349.1 molecular chaperone HtpG [Myxococcota bacterium]
METHAFQAETQKLLDLMIHSLYSNKEVFLRELISNASDALDRRRFEALSNPALAPDGPLEIQLIADRPARTLTIADNGIGMTREELVQNLGTIARSGTLEFVKRAQPGKEGDAAPDLIGQFGVGFYASFMVADEVDVVSRRAGEDGAARWTSKGLGEYGLDQASRDEAGTTIRLSLKAVDGDAGIADFCDEWVLRQVVKKYSDFVAYPIRLTIVEAASDGDAEAALPERREVEAPLNSMKAIWTRPEGEVEESDYAEFYRHITHDFQDPMLRVQTSIEGTFEARALLYVPSKAPFDLYHRERLHNGVQLYVRRVFIMDECRELLPEWLRFVRGVVDAEDLSLNVSREMLQQDRQIQTIRKHLVKKLVDRLKQLAKDDREEYEKFWAEFGPVLKEGLLDFSEKRDRIFDLVLAPSSKEPGKLVSLADYVDRMPEDQEAIYYIAGPRLDVLRRSPHLEAFEEKGIEVLFLTDPVDEVWTSQGPVTYRDKPFKSIGHGEVELGSEADREQAKAALEKDEEIYGDLLAALRAAIQDDVKEVRLSSRLKGSASCLVLEEGDLSPQLEAMLRQAGQAIPERKPILELNPKHAVLEKLGARFAASPTDPLIADAARLLLGQAVIAGGGQLEDPAEFTAIVNRLMTDVL